MTERKASAGDRVATRVSVYSLLLNIVLTVVKTAVGLAVQSDALLADAAHSGADVAGSIAVWIGLRVARRPADANHPYGHGKAEVIAAALVALLLLLAGADVSFESARALFEPPEQPSVWAFVTVCGAIAVKEIMFRWQRAVGRRVGSPALLAGAADHRSDVYSSAAAALGIGVALLGARFGIRILRYADPVAGFAVAVVVVWIGWKLARQSFMLLMDERISGERAERLARTIRATPGVLRLDDVRARAAGSYWIVDVRMSVDPDITVEAGHDIGKLVKAHIMAEFGEVREVLVHVNPYHSTGRDARDER